jgi:hypothetical protein
MCKRNHLAVVLILFAGLTLFCCSAGKGGDTTDYEDLVSLFKEFRDFQEAEITNGVPDYTPAAMEKQYRGLIQFQKRLAAMETGNWPVWQKVDYHLVRAEMNALQFHHQVFKPWARDPGFYAMGGGDAGASVNSPDFFGPLFQLSRMESALSKEQQARVQATLKGIPKLYEQAKSNLTEASADLADLAIRNNERQAGRYDGFAERLQEHHPDLVADAKSAGKAVRDYSKWLAENKHKMTAPAGVGKENYSWWMRNVQLSPWGWEENNAIIQREYDRVITFLKLEENRNRELPPLEVAMTDRAWHTNLRQALHYVVDFLRDEEIMTIPDWVDPSDYYGRGRSGAVAALEDLDDTPSDRYQSENSSVDTKYRQRELLPGETHEYIGHMLDYQRQERLSKSPIRSGGRRYNMGSMRTEGWAVALEELLMQAGVLDERPRKGREMEYLMNASHMSLSIPDMKMHANEINLAEARQLCADIMPRGWSRPEERMVWFEMQSNIRNPGGFHSNVVTGKAYFMKMFREQAQELGDGFVIRDFVDAFLESGIIPMSLIRWEMTGNSDDVTLVTEELQRS